MAMVSRLQGQQLDAAASMREAGQSLAQIQRKLGIGLSLSAIDWQLKRAGTYPPGSRPIGLYRAQSSRRAAGPVRAFTPDEDRQLLRLDLDGVPIAHIAKSLGRAVSSIRGRLITLARYDELGLLPPELTEAAA